MTRNHPQGTHPPAWLGDDPGYPADLPMEETREQVPIPPDGSPLWPDGRDHHDGPAYGGPARPGDPVDFADAPYLGDPVDVAEHVHRGDPLDVTGPAWLDHPPDHPLGHPPDHTPDHAPDHAPGEPIEPVHLRAGPAHAAADHDRSDAHGSSIGVVAVTGRRPMRPPPNPTAARPRAARSTAGAGLLALVLLALVSAFFAWVTAEPLWMAVGHAEDGAVTVTRCVDDRCLGTFTGSGFTRDAVAVRGDVPEPGVPTPARMTSARGGHAYVDVDPVSRAAVGVVLILLCGLGIVRTTGVRRLPTASARSTATLLSLAGPLLLLAAMLAATY